MPLPRIETLETLPLVDHHCHGLVRRELDRVDFERIMTEADHPAPDGVSFFDSQLGFALRRWCAPVLDLPAHAEPDDYLARRAELGADEVAIRMLRAAGVEEFCVDTGFAPERLTSSADLAAAVGGRAHDIVRLEPLAEQVALDIVTGQVGVAHFPDLVRSRLAARADARPAGPGGTPAGGERAGAGGRGDGGERPDGQRGDRGERGDGGQRGGDERDGGEKPDGEHGGERGGGGRGGGERGGGRGAAKATRENRAAVGRAVDVVGVKSVAAYRVGLELPAHRPTDREVIAAVRGWVGRLRTGAPLRLADPVLHSFLIWAGADLGLPVQIHTGFGDTDLHLARSNPLLLTDLLRALLPTGAPVLLLHCYPFHREAGYLAQVFPHVYLDVGLTTHSVGRGSSLVLGEALELAPFAKLLYSSDAFALAELYLLGATLFRRALSTFLAAGVADDDWTAPDADRVAAMICAGNARRVYRLAAPPAAEPAIAAPRVARPRAAKPRAAKPRAAKPRAAKPRAAEPSAAKTTRSETAAAPAAGASAVVAAGAAARTRKRPSAASPISLVKEPRAATRPARTRSRGATRPEPPTDGG
ncbi:amidohydrolase family protein [Frankia nepalensis]|uniref:amidohydrolase family protein n=1 Tax=Frankia nepalensis TaxID=1836974 RepID=UPI0027DB5269|nr:amidohydrolase family protein [Frankia nepalensis]